MSTAQEIDALLPQTQCGECGFPGCMPYAQALAEGMTSIDRCPPGGEKTLQAIGKLLNIDPSPLLKNYKTRNPATAIIREEECIGCTKCIQACPVDAIIGSSKKLHHILGDECTGCGLCVEPCPVDCIDIIELPKAAYQPSIARDRFNAKQVRLLQTEQAKQQSYRAKRALKDTSQDKQNDIHAKQNYILNALSRVIDKKSLHE